MNPVIDKIWVENLDCERSEQLVQRALNDMLGVMNVRTNIAEGWIEVEHEDFTDLESIYVRLAEIGYPVADTVAPLQWNL